MTKIAKSKQISRRKFLGTASCATIGTTTLFSSLLNLGAVNSLAAMNPANNSGSDDYKALVCISLSGGNDSFNMLVPRSNRHYQEYAKTRSNLALPKGNLLSLDYTDRNGKQFGLHPAMPEVQELFNNKKLAFISNIGTLVAPCSKKEYLAGSVSSPVGLLSHADQAQQWMTGIPYSRSSKGWGGRMADILQAGNENQNISMNISLSGTNIYQVGNHVSEYAIRASAGGSVGIKTYEGNNSLDNILSGGVESLLEQDYKDMFTSSYTNKIKNSQANYEEFSKALKDAPLFSSQFSDNELSANLELVAKTIAAQKILGMKRQTFFINFGGWDHHDEVLNNQETMLAVVSKALLEFQEAMEEMEMAENVTTFTMSDFGRTLTSNGNGSDHAWGGNVMVMGNEVNGGQIYGEYPSLALNGENDIGGAIMLPTTSTDVYFAELSQWFGVGKGDLNFVLPNLSRFYDPYNSKMPLGFMK